MNFIRFVPLSDDEAYEVSDVQVLIELDNGANFISWVRSNQTEEKATIAGLYDGDIRTGMRLAQPNDQTLNPGWMRNLWQKFTDHTLL